MPSPAATRPGTHRDRGSMSIEMTALVWPVTVVMTVMLIGVWQMSVARLDVHTAAAAAARAASLTDSPPAAKAAADQTAREALADASFGCKQPRVDVDTSEFSHGGQVAVRVACQVPTGDLIGLDAPGSVTTSASATAPIETHRRLEVGQP